MRFSDLVYMNSVNNDLKSHDMEGAFSEILDYLYTGRRIQDKLGILQALMDRENRALPVSETALQSRMPGSTGFPRQSCSSVFQSRESIFRHLTASRSILSCCCLCRHQI